ncbi:MAG: serine/threonine protein kinase [Lentimonas sp.]|jgi:serine/threonine protein kinase
MFKLEEIWVAPDWEQQLSTAGLLDIEALTAREFDWFERPNKRLGGWSGVTRLLLDSAAPKEAQTALFLKIQQNHCYRTIGNGFKKRLTFEREMDGFAALKGLGVLPELLLFAKWRIGGDVGSLIITKALDGFVELQDLFKTIQSTHADPDPAIRNALSAVADATRTMHATGWAHFAYKPKHVFISTESEPRHQIRLIDFERARRPLRAKTFVTEDLSRFLRHIRYLNTEQKLQFLRDYFQTDTFSPTQAKWVQELEQAKSLKDGVLAI